MHLLATLASLNNAHSSNLHTYYTNVRFSSRPNFVPAKPLCPRSAAWQSSFIANLGTITLGRSPTAKVEAHIVTSCCHVATTTLARSFIWPCNNFVFNYYTCSFSVSSYLASKPVKWKLSLHSSCLGTSVKVSTAQLTTWHMFLAITMVHLGSSTNETLIMIALVVSRSIS